MAARAPGKWLAGNVGEAAGGGSVGRNGAEAIQHVFSGVEGDV